MAFTVKENFGMVSTAKDTEFCVVQIVDITSKDGSATQRVEIRKFVDNPHTGYQGPTKEAMAFTDAEDIEAMIEMLTEAKAAFQPAPPPAPVVNPNRKPLPAKRGRAAANAA